MQRAAWGFPTGDHCPATPLLNTSRSHHIQNKVPKQVGTMFQGPLQQRPLCQLLGIGTRKSVSHRTRPLHRDAYLSLGHSCPQLGMAD